MPVKKMLFLAITGPTNSGKTLLAQKIAKKLGTNNCLVISQDNYYKDNPHLPKKERKKINFDDIKAFDFTLFRQHIKNLRQGKSVYQPYYSFVESRCLKKTVKVSPRQWVIIEGLMPFITKELAPLFNFRIYIDAEDYICLSRRIKRDIKERGDTIESVCKRYFKDVLPMQKRYVELQKRYADIVVNGNNLMDSRALTRLARAVNGRLLKCSKP